MNKYIPNQSSANTCVVEAAHVISRRLFRMAESEAFWLEGDMQRFEAKWEPLWFWCN